MERGRRGYDFVKKEADKLNPRVVLIGLSRAEGEENPPPFSNFHEPGHWGDRILKRAIQDEKLRGLLGAYMTDASPDRGEPRKVKHSGKEVATREELLDAQLRALCRADEHDCPHQYTVIYMGENALRFFVKDWLGLEESDVQDLVASMKKGTSAIRKASKLRAHTQCVDEIQVSLVRRHSGGYCYRICED